jgi:hypothetical protein
MVPDYLKDMLPNIRSNESIYATRQSQNYSISKCGLNTYKFSFVPVAIDEWNSLPLEIRQFINLHSFNNSIQMSKSVPPRTFLMENATRT